MDRDGNDISTKTIPATKNATLDLPRPLLLLVLVVSVVVPLLFQQRPHTVEARSLSSLTTTTSFVHPLYANNNNNHQLLCNRQSLLLVLTGRRRPNHVSFMVKADPFRDSNKVRPSLHPITINILVQVLKLRASSVISNSHKMSNSTLPSTLTTEEDDSIWSDQPLDVVLKVSKIASKAIQQRQQSSTVDQMTFTVEEQQTIAGRVVGVMVRLKPLETLLYTKCANVKYIQKYNEWHTFGLLEPRNLNSIQEDTASSSISGLDDMEEVEQQQLLCNDPLLLLNRAECLLALFLHTIEIPELQTKNCTVPDQSRIDFLDTDRQEVLLN